MTNTPAHTVKVQYLNSGDTQIAAFDNAYDAWAFMREIDASDYAIAGYPSLGPVTS